jgi:hypothetical protein
MPKEELVFSVLEPSAYVVSSPLYTNEVSFSDFELKYIGDLVANNMTSLAIEEEVGVRQMARFYSKQALEILCRKILQLH